MTSDELRGLLCQYGPDWIREQAARVVDTLSGAPLVYFRKYFGADAERARLTWGRIPEPPFYQTLREMGADEHDLLPLADRDAITFDSLILVNPYKAAGSDVIFHELVHVVQYRLLGVDEFVRQYVEGWMAGRDLFPDHESRYHNIPLERVASDLQETYKASHATFSVEDALRTFLRL
jgi:hypothetical protein